jgi:hypothetical protein
MMLSVNLDYDWIMGEGVNYKTSIILNGRKNFVMVNWAGVSSNDALSSPARTKRLLGRLAARLNLSTCNNPLVNKNRNGSPTMKYSLQM